MVYHPQMAIHIDGLFPLLGHFNLTPTRVERIARGVSNTQYRVDAGGERFVLRRYAEPGEQGWNRIRRTRESILYEHAVLAYAAGQGVPCIPPLPDRAGGTLAEQNGRFYALFPFVDAEPFDPPPEEKGVRAARLLAQYHDVMRGYPVTEQRPCWGYAGQVADWFHENEAGLGTAAEILDWARSPSQPHDFLREHAAEITAIGRMVAEDFPAGAYRACPVVVNHGDYMASNIGANARGLVLFDFDFCLRELRIYDLAVLIAYQAGEEHTGKNIDPVTARQIVSAYRSAAEMTPDELRLAPYMAIAYRYHIFLGNLGILKTTGDAERVPRLAWTLDGMRWLVDHRREIEGWLERT